MNNNTFPHDLVLRWAKNSASVHLNNSEDRKDAVANAWLKVQEAMPKIMAVKDPAAYVRRVIFNAVTDVCRERKKRFAFPLEDWGHVATDGGIEAVDNRIYISNVLAEATNEQRRMIEMTAEECQYDDIAKELGVHKATVSRHLTKVRRLAREAA